MPEVYRSEAVATAALPLGEPDPCSKCAGGKATSPPRSVWWGGFIGSFPTIPLDKMELSYYNYSGVISMGRTISCTATVGAGSEKHNHDLEYRTTLEHVHGSSEDVIELLPYRPYQEQINEMMKPYIDEYNEKVQARYKSAWDRYNAGITKTKPRKRDYKPMSYDYYTEHLNDTYYDRSSDKHLPLPMWRELIFGLGDKNDRANGIITRDEAVATMRRVVERWPELFPDFKLLGATIHCDEEGFYHCHIDYKPLYERDFATLEHEHGLRVGIGQETALERMGFAPEQSIINGRDKVPIRFNAFRNRIYLTAEAALNEQGLRLQYGVSATKEPDKDSGKKQPLENWQATQDAIREMQAQKNIALDIIEKDEVLPKEQAKAMAAVEKVMSIIKAVKSSPMTLFRHGYKITFDLFSQLETGITAFWESAAHLVSEIKRLRHKLDEEVERNVRLEDALERGEQRCDELQATIGRYADENHQLKHKVNQYSAAAAENRQRKEFMSSLSMGDKPLEEKFREYQRQQSLTH